MGRCILIQSSLDFTGGEPSTLGSSKAEAERTKANVRGMRYLDILSSLNHFILIDESPDVVQSGEARGGKRKVMSGKFGANTE